MIGRFAAIVLLAAAVLLVGCAGTRSPGPGSNHYLRGLEAEQRKLAAAERRIPHRPRTPAALARSIGLLRSAIARFAADLAAIAPPRAVSKLHEQLVTIARSYAAKLAATERAALARGSLSRAVGELESSTREASAAFSATAQRIDQALGKR
jgi:hypothetical protein